MRFSVSYLMRHMGALCLEEEYVDAHIDAFYEAEWVVAIEGSND